MTPIPMLMSWASTSDMLVEHAIRYLDETKVLHIHEALAIPSTALRHFIAPDGSDSDRFIVYETHRDVWFYLRGEQTRLDPGDAEKWLNGLVLFVKDCLEQRDNGSTVSITILPGRLGDNESLNNIAFILYSLGIETVKVTVLHQREDADPVQSYDLPIGYHPKVKLDDPDVLLLLLVHSVKRGTTGLSNVSQIRDMLMQKKLTRYLPGKKGERNADGYYRALQRTSKEMVKCNLLTYSNVKHRDEYALTSLGQCCLAIAESLCDSLDKKAQRVIKDSLKIKRGVMEYKRKPGRVLLKRML